MPLTSEPRKVKKLRRSPSSIIVAIFESVLCGFLTVISQLKRVCVRRFRPRYSMDTALPICVQLSHVAIADFTLRRGGSSVAFRRVGRGVGYRHLSAPLPHRE